MKKNFLFRFLHYLCLFASISLFSASFCQAQNQSVDVVVFSYNRPMQLFAFLESLSKYAKNSNEIHIIYRADIPSHVQAYEIVKQQFPHAQFHKQGSNPHQDFKPLVLSSTFSKTSSTDYVVFAVDDIIITDYFDFAECVKALQTYKGWGFFLRFGKNITEEFTTKMKNPCPRGITDSDGFFIWDLRDGKGSWGYPNCLDMTVYKKQDIQNIFKNAHYNNPNSLETRWDGNRRFNSSTIGICYLHSKIINIPMNQVYISQNRQTNLHTADELLQRFLDGWEIDISKFYKIDNTSVHVDYDVSFIPCTN